MHLHKIILRCAGYCLLMTAATLSQMLAPPIKPAAASEADDAKVAAFYRGNTVYVVIGSAVGGGFDFYGRAVGKYMAKYIPGNPTVVPQNLPGAGSFNAASRVAVTAPQDGTYIGAIQPTAILDPVLGDPSKGAKRLDLAFLGNAAENIEGCFLRTDAPAKSFADIFNTEVVLGASNGASSTREYPSILKNVLGMKFKIVTGYPGNADIFLAIDRNEVQGMCGSSILNVIASRPKWFADDMVRMISHQGSKPLPAMKETEGVRPAVSYAKTAEQKQILDLYDLGGRFGRPWVTGANVPPERIAALRTAFMKSLNDPELRKEVIARGLEISPMPGEEVQKLVSEVYAMPPELLKKTRSALGYE
ncbi:MAG: Bug family tripartite tricarboxylate transporter substrate binding protein [Alphaproteobacteria bacterium]